jgi:hypothetical protein
MKRILLLAHVATLAAFAQHPKGSLLIIETANHTQYVRDVFDNSLLAKQPGPVPAKSSPTFGQTILIGGFCKRPAGQRHRIRNG